MAKRSDNIYGSNPTDAASRIASKALSGEARDDVWGPVRDKRANQGSNNQKPDSDVVIGKAKQNSADKRFTKAAKD